MPAPSLAIHFVGGRILRRSQPAPKTGAAAKKITRPPIQSAAACPLLPACARICRGHVAQLPPNNPQRFNASAGEAHSSDGRHPLKSRPVWNPDSGARSCGMCVRDAG